MGTWQLADGRTFCGWDNAQIPEGQPVYAMTGQLRRCETHVPEHARLSAERRAALLAKPEPKSKPFSSPSGFTATKAIRTPFDARMAAAGKDE